MDVLISAADKAALKQCGRWFVEQEKLKHFFPTFQLLGGGGGVSKCRGTLATNWDNTYAVELTQLEDFPYSQPLAFVADIKPTPHMYRAGNICYMNPQAWHPERCTLAFVVGKIAIYLNKYEVYIRNGQWPGVEE
ncbi:MAG TPA: hypothetical protein PKD41_10785 [Solidesulfovibrio sp.]|jgi:hypothetical protein|nr:hypothetical protein [Desulfovibrio sp.]HML61371.1 hypothetical protein [Solidesulfovibrio sp.]